MIVSVEALIKYLSSWVANYAEKNGKFNFVLIQKETRNEVLASYICSQATALHGGLRTQTIKSEDESLQPYIYGYEVASKTNGIIVGSIDKSHGLYSRNYEKAKLGLMDICPLFDLEYSEIIQATSEIFPDKKYEEKSNDDYILLEFCNYAERRFGIITNEDPPHKNARWPFFTKQQKDWIAKVHQREKLTRHKIMNRPHPKVPEHLCNGPGR